MRVYLTLIGLSLLWACGSDDSSNSGSVVGRCNYSAIFQCTEYTGSSYDDSRLETACENGSDDAGEFSTSACSDDSLIGTCLLYSGQDTELTHHYYTGAELTSSELETTCDTGEGTWTSGS